MKFMKRAPSEFHKFHMKSPRVKDSVYHMKWDLIAYKINIISARKHVVDTDVVNDVTSSRQSVTTRVVMRFL